MATVKSLDERTFEMSEDIAVVRSTVAVLVSKMDAMQGQLAAALTAIQANQTQIALLMQKSDVTAALVGQVEKNVVVETEQVERELGAKIGQTDAKVDRLATSYTAFEARGDLTNKFLKWLGGLAAVTLIAIIGSAITIARSVGRLEEQVKGHQEALSEQKIEMKEMRRDLADIKRDLADIKAKLK